MNQKEKPVELLVICVVMIVLGVGGVIAGFSRDLLGNLDGILMLAVSLMMALIFAVLLFFLAKEQGWIGKHHDDVSSSSSSTGATAAGK